MSSRTSDISQLIIAGQNLDTIPKPVSADFTVTVGSGGEFATINEAIAYLTTRFSPAYVAGGFTAEISLLTGFEMAEQVAVVGMDLSWITITAVDAEVTIIQSALTTAYGGDYPVFYVEKGKLPIIGVLFSMDASGTSTNRHGIMANGMGSVYVLNGAGIKNAGGHGLFANNTCRVVAVSTDFSGAGINGIYFAICCIGRITSANVSGAGQDGLSVGGSSVYADSINASGATRYGVYANRRADICAASASILNAGDRGVFANSGSFIDIPSAIMTGATNYGIRASNSSIINASSANGQNGASPASTDISVGAGAYITATSATGGLSQTKNVPTANGIIFQA